jgi:hypothetical protein
MSRKGIYLVNLPPASSNRTSTGSYSIPPGTAGYVLQTDPTSTNGFSWVMTSSGGGGGGSPTGPAGGDLTGSYPNPTLATITASTGPIGSSNTVPIITIDAKGRVTSLGTATITGISPSGDAGGDLTGSYPNPTLKEIGTGIGPIGSATTVPIVTTDNKGRITTLSSTTIAGVSPGGSAGGDLTGSYPNPTLKEITTAATVGSATAVPILSIDAKGRVITLISASIQIAESQVTNLTTDLSNLQTTASNLSSSFYPLSSSFVSLSGSVNTLSSSLAAVSSSDAGKVNRSGDTMTGNLTLVSGSNSVSPLKFVSGSLLGTPTAGNMEYDGTNLYFTTGSVREFVALSGSLAAKVSKAGDRMTGALGINNGSTAIAATDLHIGAGSITVDGAVSTRLEPMISSPGNYPRTLTFHPTYTGNTGVNAIALQVLPEISGAGVSMPELYGISSAFTGSATKWIGLAVLDGGGSATTKYDAIFNGGGNVGVGTSTPAAKFEVSGQTRTNAIGINRSGGTITATDLQIGSGSTAFDGNVSIQIEPVISSPGNYPRTMFFHPKYTGNTTNNAISLQVQPEVGAAVSMPDLYGISSAFVGSATKWTAIYVYDGGGTATNKYDAIFNGGGNVGIRTTAPTARLQIGAGTATANTAPLKFTSGTNLTTPEAGAMEYDGSNLYFTTGSVRESISNKVSRAGDTMTGNLNISANNQLFLQATGNLRLGVGFSAGSFSSANAVVEFKPHASTRFTFLDNVIGSVHNPVFVLADLDGGGRAMALYADQNSSAFIYSDLGNFDITSDTKANIQAGTFGGGTLRFRVDNSGSAYVTNKMYVGGSTTPTALIHIKAGTATANTAPLKFTSGSNLSAVEAGAMEYDGTNLYFTPVASRKTVAYKRNVTSATSALTASVDACIIASGSFTITLPNPSTVGSGAEILVKKTSTGTSTVTISASAGTIDGSTTTTLTTQYSSYTFISDGSTNWWII